MAVAYGLAQQEQLVFGRAIRLTGALQDVTETVTAKQALRQANERVALATTSGGIGIWDWDITANVLSCDPWMYRLHGKNEAIPIAEGDLWRDHLHPKDRSFVEQALDDAVNGVKDYDTEFRIVWEDGSIHHLRGAARVTRDESGRALHMIGANWDVTESRRLIAQLAEQHERLRVTLHSIGDGVITTDAQCQVSWLNPVAERMTGWSNADAAGRPLTEVFQAVDKSVSLAAASPVESSLVQGNSAGTIQHTVLISRDHNEYGIENSAAPICDTRGELLGNVLVFHDVTEQRRLAAEAEQASKLQLKLKDEFLSHVSHELRSPLTSIYSFSSIIADGLAGETTPQQQEYLQIMLKNTVQLQSMIEDILTVTISNEGKLNIDLQPVALWDAIIDTIHVVESAATAKNILLTSDTKAELSPALADPTRLRQVLIILLDNAIKFTPREGRISIKAFETQLGFLHVQVTDTGCGIPMEKWTLIFNKLYQIPGPDEGDTSHSGRTGLGLGLHIARNLIKRQGGDIWVTSTPNRGSVFNFTLPIYPKQHNFYDDNNAYRVTSTVSHVPILS